MNKIILCFLLAISTYGQAPPNNTGTLPEETNGLLNGRFWKAQTTAQKEIFLLGYATGSYDGALLVSARAGHDGTPVLKELFPTGMSPAEVALAVDRFYATPENIRVVINAAIKIVAMRTAGADEAKIQKATADARSSAAK
jgi:hypothetical protein